MTPPHPPEERRGSGRAPTIRAAYVQRRQAHGAGFEATVEDVGPLGMRFSCGAPLARGDALYIEVFPKDPAGSPYAVRGVVRHARRAGALWQVGVQLNAGLPSAAESVSLAAARREIDALRHALASLDKPAATRLTFNLDSESRPPTRSAARNRRRLWPLLVALLLFALLLGGGTVLMNQDDWRPWQRTIAKPAPAPHVPPSPKPSLAYEPAQDEYARAWDALDNPALLESLPPLPPRLQPSDADTFVDAWLNTRVAIARGDRDSALAAAAPMRTMLDAGTAPESWRARGEELLQFLSAESQEPSPLSSPQPMLALDTPLMHEPTPETPGQAIDGLFETMLRDGVWIDVNTSTHTLTLFKNDKPLRHYPVGLGANGATPHGEFTIAHRIHRPDWYNRGATIPYGDPANPLGDYWLGLAAPGAPQGIGIHPTQDESSIGANQSRGCIRMFPEDAQHIFTMCTIGTRVNIHP